MQSGIGEQRPFLRRASSF